MIETFERKFVCRVPLIRGLQFSELNWIKIDRYTTASIRIYIYIYLERNPEKWKLPEGVVRQKVWGGVVAVGTRKHGLYIHHCSSVRRLIGRHYLRTHYDPLLIKLRLCRGVNPASDSEIGISGSASSETSATFKIPPSSPPANPRQTPNKHNPEVFESRGARRKKGEARKRTPSR